MERVIKDTLDFQNFLKDEIDNSEKYDRTGFAEACGVHYNTLFLNRRSGINLSSMIPALDELGLEMVIKEKSELPFR